MISRSFRYVFVVEALDIRDAAHDRSNAVLGREENVRSIGEFEWSVLPFAGENVGRPRLVTDGDELERDRSIENLSLKCGVHTIWALKVSLGTKKPNVVTGVDESLSLDVERKMDCWNFREALACHFQE